MKPEEGITQDSLDNAVVLIKIRGVPSELHFYANEKECDYFVTAKWPSGFEWKFTGFAWGYGGTGPAGLLQFFDLAKVSSLIPDDLPIDKYGKTTVSWFRDPSKTHACL